MLTKIIMPKLGETMEEGEIGRWLKKEGEKVGKGEPLFEVITDKANFEVESPASGFLRKILFKEADTVAVTNIIGYIADSVEEELPETTEEPRKGTEVTRPPLAEEKKVKASPLARKIAREKGIDLSQIEGSGPGGRITRGDVEGFQPPTQAQPEIIPLSGIRKTIAQRLTQSKREAPHYYVQTEIDMSDAVKLRQDVVEEIEKSNEVRLSYTDLIIKSVALALKEFPLLNSTFEDGRIKSFKQINIGVAVALEKGLVVPVIREADRRTLAQIARERIRLTAKAKDNKLTLEDLSEGTFTVSNLGMFEVDVFTGIINPPQVAILTVGRIKDAPLVVNGQVAIRHVMKVSLSLDHRVVDGAYGAKFLGRVKELLEKPHLLIIKIKTDEELI